MSEPVMDEGVWHDVVPHALAQLLRSYGASQFDLCEDAVQEACLQAAQTWPNDPPADPRAWLVTVARRRFIDRIRSEQRRRDRELREHLLEPPPPESSLADDSLLLLQLSCSPALSRSQQVTLTLRAVCGLSTTQIANLYQVPRATIEQRITRAKQQLRTQNPVFNPVKAADDRLDVVLDVLYLMLTEGHHTTSGSPANDVQLTHEALRLLRLVHDAIPDNTEATGLLALALFTEARAEARKSADGELVPLGEQDRACWTRKQIAEALALLDEAVRGTDPGPYLIQACITALHMQAPSTAETDWDEILALYELLEVVGGTDNPNVRLNRIVAHAAVHGPKPALVQLAALERDHPDTPRIAVVRAHLLTKAGQLEDAEAAYRSAVAQTQSLAEQRYLRRRLRELAATAGLDD